MNRLPTLDLLRNHIDITRVPFSDRGSRLLVYQEKDQPRLFVKLAERLTSIKPDIEAYLRRPPYITDLSLIDENHEPLDFEVTTFPHLILFHTRLGDFKLILHNEWTLSFGVPDGVVAGLRFIVAPQYWEQTPKGGIFRSVRNMTYSTSGEILHNQIEPERGGYRVELVINAEQDQGINLTVHHRSMENPDDMLPFSTGLNVAESRWDTWFKRVPAVNEKYLPMYAYAWWVMANNLISPLGNVPYEAMMPSKVNYVGLWLWDSALHALAYRHIDPDLARNQIRAVIAHQLPNGMLPDAIFDEGLVYTIDHPIIGAVTKPPIIAWAALKLHETDPNIPFLREIYPALVRFNAWWFAMNDDDGDGLVQYSHPYSSGLDDSPLWDEGMPVESPDINTYLCLQMEAFGRIADILGQPGEGEMWRRRKAALTRRIIKDMWDEDAGLFWALKDDKPLPVVTPFNLYPIWIGDLPESMTERVIQHLQNPNEFAGPYVLPTVARNDPDYNPEVMWRGPVWANINYFFVEALEKVGRKDLSDQLMLRTLDMIAAQKDIYEYYNAETGEPPTTSANIFGWTAAVFIDLAIRASQREDLMTDPIAQKTGE